MCIVQYVKYAIMEYMQNMQYVNYVNMQNAKYARRSGSCRWDGNMFSALFAMKTIVGEANTSIR